MNREKRACQPHLCCTVLLQPSHTPYLVHSVEDGLVELFPRVGSKGVISAVRVAQQEEMSEGDGVLFPECHHQLIAEPKENELPRRSQRLARKKKRIQEIFPGARQGPTGTAGGACNLLFKDNPDPDFTGSTSQVLG